MPRTRLPVSERLVLHHVHLAVDLDANPIGVPVISGHIVPNDVARRSPDKLNSVLLQDFASALQLGPILHFERNMMQGRRLVVDEIHRVMIHSASQKRKMVTNPVRRSKSKHVIVKGNDLLHVLHTVGDVPELQRANPEVRFVAGMKVGRVENLDKRSLGITKDDGVGNPRCDVGAPLAAHALFLEMGRQFAKIAT
jgi:hypothetical protein